MVGIDIVQVSRLRRLLAEHAAAGKRDRARRLGHGAGTSLSHTGGYAVARALGTDDTRHGERPCASI